MQTLNIMYFTLGRIRGLNISFKIHVGVCQSEQGVLGLLGQSGQYYSKPILVYQGVLGLECSLTTNKLVVVEWA